MLGLALGDELIDRSSVPGASHSREILPSIESLLIDAKTSLSELDAIIFGQGPGSFTGLRISVGVVQGLGYGLNLPLVPVSSMAALAQVHAGQGENIFVALTARLEEIYFGGYSVSGDIVEPIIDEGVADVSMLPRLSEGSWAGLGNAWGLKDKIEESTGISVSVVSEETVPSVSALLTLGRSYFNDGRTVSALEARPVYLREEVAQKNP